MGREDAFSAILVAIDEIAYFSATVGDRKTQETFSALLRDLVARGPCGGHRCCGGDAASIVGHHPDQLAGPVRLAVCRPVHDRCVVGHRARSRLGGAGLVGELYRPEQPRRRPAHC